MNVYSKIAQLRRILNDMDRVLVAFSGGVDSTLLLKMAQDVLDDKVLAVTATSPTYPKRELEAAVALANYRKLRVVAEGVENEAQRILLVRWQCNRMQGFLSGPPSTAEETERWLEEYNTIRPHESLGDISPLEFLNHRGHADLSTYGWI